MDKLIQVFDNINNYLSDLDGDKLDLLISNKTNLLN
jgi:hypothetical protein